MTNSHELKLGKFGNQGSINTDGLKGGIKREDAEKAGFANIFDAFDDGNKILTEDEVQNIKNQIQPHSQKGKDSIFSKNEAEDFIQTFNNNANNQNKLENIDAEKLFDFLKFIENKSKSVISSSVDDENNTVTKYRDEKGHEVTETVNSTTGIVERIVSANGKEIKTLLKGGKKTQETETDTKTGTVTTTIYDEDGETIKSKTIEEKSPAEKTTTITYKNGQEKEETVITNDSEEKYVYVDGEKRLVSKIEDKNGINRKETTIEYSPNGRKETVTDRTGTTVVEKEENVTVETKNGKTIKTTKTESGYTEEVRNENSNDVTINSLDKNKNKLSQKKTVNGVEYNIEYDGKGNTKGIVVQYGENAESIANKFGVTKESLLKINGKNEGDDFKTGDVIVIPKEIEADDKVLKGRKSPEDAIKEQQIADEKARQREIARQKAKALDKQYKAAGLKNYEHKGEKFEYGKETYTVIGTMNNRARLMVKDSKGNILIASHDHKILKDSYVQLTTAYDKGTKTTLKNGKQVVILEDRNDGHGRKYALDSQGRQVVVSGGKSQTDMSDRVVLNNSYVDASDSYDILKSQINTEKTEEGKKRIITQHKSVSNENIVRLKGGDGKVWYFDLKTGKPVNLTQQEAQAIVKEIDASAHGWFFGLGTDEEQMSNASNQIIDPEVLSAINKYYSEKGYNDNSYKSSFEAFLATEISNSEIYEINADLVNNGAITSQERRDEILMSNMTTYGKKSANRNKALRAISNRTDYDNLQTNLTKYNKENGYNAHFKGQDAIQTTLYNQTGGNASQIDYANRALIDSNENFLSHDEIIRIQAEVGALYLEKGDSTNATRSQDAEILSAMDGLETTEGVKINVSANANKIDLMIADYGNFSDEEYAQEVIDFLKLADESINRTINDLGAVVIGEGHEFDKITMASTDHQEFENYATKAHQLIKNYNVLKIVKEKMGTEYERITKRIEHESSEREKLSDPNSVKEAKINFSNLILATDTETTLGEETINSNLDVVDNLKTMISDLEKEHLNNVDAEGWKLDFVNELRQTNFWGTTRADVSNQYAMSKSNIQKLELAAKGQLVDANGNKIKFEDAVEQLTGKTVQELQELNQEYQTHQQYGEMGVDITTGIVTMVVPVPGLGVGKLFSQGGKIYKVVSAINTARQEYRVVEVGAQAINAGIKVGTAQYTLDRTNIATSVSGNDLEHRGLAENKALEAGENAAAGTFIGGTTGIISSKISTTAGKAVTNITGYGADLTATAVIGQSLHGGKMGDYFTIVNEDGTLNTGNILNMSMTSMGYLNGLKGVKNKGANTIKTETPHLKPFEETHLAKLGNNGEKVSIGGQKYKLIKEDLEVRLKNATEEDLAIIQKHVDSISNPQYKAELNSMIEARKLEIEANKVIIEPEPVVEPEPIVEPKPEPSPEPTTPKTKTDFKLTEHFKKLPESAKKIYHEISDAIDNLKTLSGINALRNKINTNFSQYREVLNNLMTKLENQIAKIKGKLNSSTAVTNNTKSVKLTKGNSAELPENAKIKIGYEILDMENLKPELKAKIEAIPEGGELKLGRNDIEPTDMTISSEHIVIKRENGKLKITDTSTNGTVIMDKANFEGYNNIQQLKNQHPEFRTKEFSALERRFLELSNSDYATFSKLLNTEGINVNSHQFKTMMQNMNTNNITILEQFANGGITRKTASGVHPVSQQDVAMLMLFNRNNTDVSSLISSPKKVNEFLTNTTKELNNLRKLGQHEIADAILSGKVDLGNGVPVKCTPPANILDDMECLIRGEDYIKHFTKNDTPQTMFSKTQIGDVASVKGKMYVNDGTQMVPLSLSEKGFRELFPPVERFSIHQGNNNNCYLDTTLNILANSKKGRAKIYQMFNEKVENGKTQYYTKTANGNWRDDLFIRQSRRGKDMREHTGLAMLEVNYTTNEHIGAISGRNEYINSNLTYIETEVHKNGGSCSTALKGLTGDDAVYINNPDVFVEKIKNLANRDDVFMAAGTRVENRGTGHSHVLNEDLDLHQWHAYSIKGYDPSTNCVKVANPWHSGLEIEVPMTEFVKQFRGIFVGSIS